MALFTETEVRQRARRKGTLDGVSASQEGRSAKELLKEASASFTAAKEYDIFLSHSIKDAEIVLGIKGILEDLKYSVYVDWVEDSELDRSRVTPETANILRERMAASKSLFYVTTENSENSRWMPWECGYFDGLREKVAIVPVKRISQNSYAGQEYLGLYPYCTRENSNKNVSTLWINKDSKTYLSYNAWVKTRNEKLQWRTL